MIKFLRQQLFPLRRYGNRIFSVLGTSARKGLARIIFGFIFLSTLDLIGLSLIGPFVALATNGENLSHIPGISLMSRLFGIDMQAQVITWVGVIIVVVFAIKSFASFFINRSIIRFALRHQKDTKLRLLRAYLSLPLERALQKNSANLLTTVHQHTLVFTNRVMIPMLKSISELVFFTFLFVFLLVNNPFVTLLLGFTFAILSFVYDAIVKKKIALAGANSILAVKTSTKIISQSSDGFKEIRIAGADSFFLAQLEKYSDLYAEATTYSQSLAIVPRNLIESSVVTFVVVLMIVGLAVYDGPSPELMSTVGMFAFAALRAMPSINALMSAGNHLRYGRSALFELQADLQEAANYERMLGPAARPDDDKRNCEIKFQNHLCVEKIQYKYPNEVDSAVNGISLRISKGESVGIIGGSGSGKTTLIDLLLGLLQPQEGRVLADGQPITDNLRSWMDKVAYIPQSAFLLDDTIVANVAFGEFDIDMARVKESLVLAQLETFVSSLPNKENTVVGERGARLSGGQRQRIVLARALYHTRDLLVMDEATAALDSETEQEVVEAVRALRGKVTMIIIAHRLTTLKYCDTIYVLEKGRLVRSGSYQEVVAKRQ